VTPSLAEFIIVQAPKLPGVVIETVGGRLHLVKVMAVVTCGRFLLFAFANNVKFFTGQFNDPLESRFESGRHLTSSFRPA
jgi:hypothetical protein